MAKTKTKEEPKKHAEKPVSKVNEEPLKANKSELKALSADEIHNELVNKNLANKG